MDHLVAECAYEHWHRMLFARFLAECGLLVEPASGVAVSIEECKELARERGFDWVSLAALFAQRMLPQMFRPDDAVLEITLPAEHRQPLEQVLMSLPTEVFLADDSLGWVYQFWQSQEKKRVNKSGQKIGADELSSVTQLFTEDYMVDFLLHNTLGAWWTGRQFPAGVEANSEEEARARIALPGVEWTHLRLVQDDAGRYTPATGTLDEWPIVAREIRVLDPCMGSGHFLVSVVPILAAMRVAEESLSEAEAYASVLRENVFGLEIDPRCSQIAAFSLALATWRQVGWHPLPPLNIACSGLSPNAQREEWTQLGGEDEEARRGMAILYDLFTQAPILGSLINPTKLRGDLLTSSFRQIHPMLEKALSREDVDEAAHEIAVTAQGIAKAAAILSDVFTLVITNVPYLGRGGQAAALQRYCEDIHPDAKADLATCFIERSFDFCKPGGTTALVTPQAWLLLGTYRALRQSLLRQWRWDLLAKLGPGAFGSITGEQVNVALSVITRSKPASQFSAEDATLGEGPAGKSELLRDASIARVAQSQQLGNPDSRVILGSQDDFPLLSRFSDSFKGLSTGDLPRFIHCFWELGAISEEWVSYQGGASTTQEYGGRTNVLLWESGSGAMVDSPSCYVKGTKAWGKWGVSINQMHLGATLYSGEMFDENAAVVIPNTEDQLLAIWEFARSDAFRDSIEQIDESMKITNKTLIKVPFDLDHWKRIAASQYPDGLPTPYSADPTQWLFHGSPHDSLRPLQVATARLLGYRWPRQTGSAFANCLPLPTDSLEPFVDDTGIVCISPVKGEESASMRLTSLLAASYGAEWSAAKLEELLSGEGGAGLTVEEWLRTRFFEQHCELFHQRPFIWHVWDGSRDGFSALVNYHLLTRTNLEKVTYAYLGDWISRQQAAVITGEAGADARLASAAHLQSELKMILEGEPPYDIFIRWKALAKQPIGWDPDVNDGVRVNIRPFLMAADLGRKSAGILRARPNIKWDKDRGKELQRSKDEFPWFWDRREHARDFGGGSSFDGNRWNDVHYSREFKMAARGKKGFA